MLMAESEPKSSVPPAELTTVAAPAKVNLTLAVKSRRSDGFHEIESFVVAVTLFDELSIASRLEPGIGLECTIGNLPCDSRNLIHRAAVALAEDAGIEPALTIHLRKRIPIGAGLGGGSSDAAATLTALNDRWGLNRSVAQLSRLAARIGSDVPFFLLGSAAILRSRGERVEPVRFHWPGWIVLLLPPIELSTAEVYRRWTPGDPEPSAAAALAAVSGGAARMTRELGNMLERPAFAVSPELADLHRQAERLGAEAVHLSGSGSALFALFDEPDPAAAFADRVEQTMGIETRRVQCLTAKPSGFQGGVHGNH